MNSSGFFLMNWDTVTRVTPEDGGTSNIDLVFSSGKMASRVEVGAWAGTLGFDHYPLSNNALVTKSQ